jgi:hypothetical protein
MKRFIMFSAAVFAVLALLATSAIALTKPKLSFTKGGGATIGWSTEGGSSPGDPGTNEQSLRVFVPAGGGATAYTYGASEALVGIRGLPLSQIDRLGFDSKGYLGAGAPRISLGTTGDDGGHTYFLSAFYCNDPIAGSDWRTSDFVDDTTNCTIHRDGVQLTWQAAVVIADANDEVVASAPNDWFFIQDEPTAIQGGSALVYVDRLTGQNWMWIRGGNRGAIFCSNPGCI